VVAASEDRQDPFCTSPKVELGFWPAATGTVTPMSPRTVTLKVAQALKASVLNQYLLDVEKLLGRLTFDA